jgi:hypothetical protein
MLALGALAGRRRVCIGTFELLLEGGAKNLCQVVVRLLPRLRIRPDVKTTSVHVFFLLRLSAHLV